HNGNSCPQRFFRLVNTANDVFAARVIGVRFAGKNNLKMASIFRNLAQAIEVGQDEVGALVAGGAACEANRKYLRIQMEARFRTDQFKQLVLGDLMRRPNILFGYAKRAEQTEIVYSSRVDIAIENLMTRCIYM